MNQEKLDVIKETARVNNEILAISELKWIGVGEYNSNDHYTYYCEEECLGRNGIIFRV